MEIFETQDGPAGWLAHRILLKAIVAFISIEDRAVADQMLVVYVVNNKAQPRREMYAASAFARAPCGPRL
jgi:hypothetical protein